MKKLGKKLSFLTKIMLVIGLLISNLSSLSVVFAYEVSESLIIELVDDKLNINYTEALAEDVENVSVKVYENYTYLNGLSEEEVVKSYSLDTTQMEAALEGSLELEYESIFATSDMENFKLFDGTYDVKVEIIKVTTPEEEMTIEETTESLEVDEIVEEETVEVVEEVVEVTEVELLNETLVEVTEEVIATGEFEKVITHESGLRVKLFDTNGVELSMVDNKYLVTLDNSSVVVAAQLLSGGLNPTDVFVYDGVEYMASDLLEHEFRTNHDFNGYLFGEYVLPVEVTLLKPLAVTDTNEDQYEEVVYTENINVMYESYELNAEVLNESAKNEELETVYEFYSDSKDGVLYVLTDLAEGESKAVVAKTMLDLYNIVENVFADSEIVKYQLLKKGEDVLAGYDATTATQTLEEYLATIELDETVVLSLSNEGLTVTYRVVVTADLDNDNALTEADLLKLIDQVVGESEITDLEKSDVYKDDEVNTLDVIYLNQVVKTQSWDVQLKEEEAKLNASLNVIVNSDEALVSGDEFDVQYVLSLEQYEAVNGFSGMFEYDKEALELISVETLTDWLGNYSKDTGKFLYLGEESLTGPEEVLPETDASEDSVETAEVVEEETIVTEDYVLLTVTFKALKSGTHTVTVKDNEYFNNATYLVLEEDLVASVDVVVSASEDNTLSYLEVAGQVITLEENKYEYETTVLNDVTLVDLKYILSNVAANVTSIVCPEELVEGENTVVVTVTSESGVSQDYTITVVREALEEEETTTQVSNNYYGDYEVEEEEVVVTPAPEEDEEEEPAEEKESNLSRIIIIILILLVIAGLVYLIFKDDDDEETKKANKDVNKLKKESLDSAAKTSTVHNTSSNVKVSSDKKTNSNNNKKKKTNSNKKER